MTEQEVSLEIGEKPMNVQEIDPLGYGDETSPISYEKQLRDGELTPEIVTKALELFESKECMVDVHEHDDGCIDGRCAVAVSFFKDGEELTNEADNSNHERLKVAGGGYITGTAITLGLGAEYRQSTIDQQIATTGDLLRDKDIFCGVHTAPVHGNPEGTGCGANDRMPTILQNGLNYSGDIALNLEALTAVAGLQFKPEVFAEVLNNWAEAIGADGFSEGSNGASRLGEIKGVIKRAQEKTEINRPVAVSKHLDGDHKEDFIILNFVEGKTFSQGAFANKLAEAFPDVASENLAQAFAVDVPRIVELAKALSPDDESFEKALYAGVAYQLATAATLTDGTLRTFIVA